MMKVHISEGNSKMGAVPSVSLTPVASCGPDVLCKKDCYACKLMRTRKEWRLSAEKNLKAFKENPGGYFADIVAWLRVNEPKLFRWHVAGDIPAPEYLACMFKAAEHFPKTKFMCFTKRMDYLAMGQWAQWPKNLNVIVSRWPGDTESPHRFVHENFAQAWISTDDRAPKPGRKVFECQGRCDECAKCWNLKPGQHVVLKKH